MNHLREAVECLSNGTLLVPIVWDDALGNYIANSVMEEAERAMCFYVGEPENCCEINPIVGTSETPSDVCWYEFGFKADGGDRVIVGLLTVHEKGKYRHVALRRMRGDWEIAHVVIEKDGGNFLISPQSEEDVAINFIKLRNVIVSSMRCTNVHREESKPDARLQKRREKDGKKPLFSYWTLRLSGESSGDGSGIGSHGSPRLHFRRGHIREYKAGFYTWVQACLVGNGDLGYVHKDYDVSAPRKDSPPAPAEAAP